LLIDDEHKLAPDGSSLVRADGRLVLLGQAGPGRLGRIDEFGGHDTARLSAYAYGEITRRQPGYWLTLSIDNVHIDGYEFDPGAKRWRLAGAGLLSG
jgi:hypothetical protein